MQKNLSVSESKSFLKKSVPVIAGVGASLFAVVASAAVDTQITDAITSGKENIGAVAMGLMSMAAILTGLGIILSALKR